MDARHHPFDVLSGSLLGITVAWCSYRQYFPPVSEYWKKGRAYPIRTWGRPPVHPADRDPSVIEDDGLEPLRQPEMRLADEEEGGAGYSSAAAPSAARAGGENVFRKQISNSQRLRQQEYQARQASGPLPYSQQGPPPLPKHTAPPVTDPSPFTPGAGNRRHNRHDDDDYEDSSSNDPDESYELEPSYTLTDSRNQMNVQSFSAVEDTSYKSSVPPLQSPAVPEPLQVRKASPPLPPQPQRKPVTLSDVESVKKEDDLTEK